jgi:hypothetical protein
VQASKGARNEERGGIRTRVGQGSGEEEDRRKST